MKTIDVSITWNNPDEENWLNADNIAIALHVYCPNTQFEVEERTYFKEEIKKLAKFLRANFPKEVETNASALFEKSSAVDLVMELLSK